MMKPTILIIEDEAPLVELLRYNLEKEGYSVYDAPNGEEGLLKAEEIRLDLIILDWMMPLKSGLEVCREIRSRPNLKDLPIILLTARGEEDDRVRGLNCGADDYLTKPFSITELLARIRAILRRTRPAISEEILIFEDIKMDLAAHRVTRAERPIHLGPTEFRLLQYLMEHPGRVFSREKLLDTVWGHDADVEPRTVDVHIRRLRNSINLAEETDPIRTVRSFGYAIDTSNDNQYI